MPAVRYHSSLSQAILYTMMPKFQPLHNWPFLFSPLVPIRLSDAIGAWHFTERFGAHGK
jgi:hypothetical protein